LPADYNQAVEGLEIGPTVGSCGTAAFWNVPVIVEDIQNDFLWRNLARLAKKSGVAACWSHPFSSQDGRVLGALALYYPEPLAPTAEQLSRLKAAAGMTGLAVERGRAEEALRRSEAEARQLASGLSEKQRQLESALRRAEEASTAKSEFLATVSHELRTPLNSILGFGSLLEGASLDKRSGEYLRVLLQASERLEALVADLLDLSRAERGELVVRQRSFQLGALVEQTIEALLPQATEKEGLTLQGSISKTIPAWVRGDPRRIQQVLGNLLGNALRYTEAGHVTLSVVEGDEPGAVRFCVRDTGPGIPAGKREEIFERFARCSPSGDGLGLGLAISQSLVLRMGGSIEVESELGQGAAFSFTLTLPASAPATAAYAVTLALPGEATDDESGVEAGALPALRILIAEDNANNRLLIREYLRGTNCSLTFARDGIEALELFHPEAFDLVLVDLQMPRLDGYATIRALRAVERDRSGSPMPILAISADAYPESIEKCIAAGASAHLAKPLRYEQLFDALREHGRTAPAPPPRTPENGLGARLLALRGPYLLSQRDHLRRMRGAFEEGDMGTLTSLAHQVKGTAASFGIEALGEAAEELEARGLVQDRMGIRAALETFASVLDSFDGQTTI
jgi:signal transduction histidine kinase/CheY-like chemotaxis protein/HPt (histidine-containing phosphotransfer) domain-containing protein